jgi:hypothetical protein
MRASPYGSVPEFSVSVTTQKRGHAPDRTPLSCGAGPSRPPSSHTAECRCSADQSAALVVAYS